MATQNEDVRRRAEAYRDNEWHEQGYTKGFYTGVCVASVVFLFVIIAVLLFSELERDSYPRENYTEQGR